MKDEIITFPTNIHTTHKKFKIKVLNRQNLTIKSSYRNNRVLDNHHFMSPISSIFDSISLAWVVSSRLQDFKFIKADIVSGTDNMHL